MKIKAAFATDQGKKRKENQDVVLCNEDIQLYAVSDGMGGVLCGKQAAEMTCTFLNMFMQTMNLKWMDLEVAENVVSDTITKVSTMIQKSGNEGFRMERYGATLTGLCVHENHAIVFNVGDSRVYVLKNGENMKQLTRDDNLYQLVLGDEDMVVTELDAQRLQNQLTQFMGMNDGVFPTVNSIEMDAGDRFLVCSDGLTKMLSETEIQTILKQDQTLEERVGELIEAANAAGGHDNISVILLEV